MYGFAHNSPEAHTWNSAYRDSRKTGISRSSIKAPLAVLPCLNFQCRQHERVKYASKTERNFSGGFDFHIYRPFFFRGHEYPRGGFLLIMNLLLEKSSGKYYFCTCESTALWWYSSSPFHILRAFRASCLITLPPALPSDLVLIKNHQIKISFKWFSSYISPRG